MEKKATVLNGLAMTIPGYERLADVLVRAYHQSATGKGAERHGVGQPFHLQPIVTISKTMRDSARHGPAYQIVKKIEEAQRLTHDRKIAELLGAIVYTAAMVIGLEDDAMSAATAGDVIDALGYALGYAPGPDRAARLREMHLRPQSFVGGTLRFTKENIPLDAKAGDTLVLDDVEYTLARYDPELGHWNVGNKHSTRHGEDMQYIEYALRGQDVGAVGRAGRIIERIKDLHKTLIERNVKINELEDQLQHRVLNTNSERTVPRFDPLSRDNKS